MGPKALENIIDMDISFEVKRERTVIKRIQKLIFTLLHLEYNMGKPSCSQGASPISIHLKGLIKCGQTGPDRQSFYINCRPCNMNKVCPSVPLYRLYNLNIYGPLRSRRLLTKFIVLSILTGRIYLSRAFDNQPVSDLSGFVI